MDSTAGPRVVGRYLLYDAIASGGMATVHLGRLVGPAGFSRTVAIKRMHEILARDPDYAAMFLDEARIVTRIRHPNVVPTLDVVALDNELLLVMEYVAGEALSLLTRRARAAKKPPPVPVLVDIMMGVLQGLHAAHEAIDEKGEPLHIVHRDVSPQNILVGTDGIARVADFGVAKSSGPRHHTRNGQVKGKLQYMAPEQLRGKPVTPATDVFAASLVLWEAITGEDAFAGESEAELVYNVLEGKPEPPSRLRPEVPRALDDVILQGLSKDPAERFISAKAMAAALESVVPPVSRSAVGRWVRECAGEDIARKAEHVARVERDISGSRATPVPASGVPTSSRGYPFTPTGTSTSNFSVVHTPQPPASVLQSIQHGRTLVLGAGAFAAGVVAVLVLWRPSGAQSATSAPSASSTVTITPAASETRTPEPTASAEPEAAAPERPIALPSASHAVPSPAKSAPIKPRQAKPETPDRIYRRE